jgi:predicted MFS family arabinose efflux permease
VFNISVSPFIFRHTRIDQRVYAFTMNAAAVMGAQLVGFTIGGRLPQFLNELGMADAGAASLKLAMALSLSCTFLALVPMSQILRAPVPRNRKPLLQGLADKDWSTIGKLMAPKVAIALCAGMIFPFMNVYLTSKFDLGTAAVGQAFGVLQLCMFFGITISPLMLRRFDRLRFMMYTALLSVPFMLTMAFATSVGLVLGAFFIRGMLMNMSAPMTSLFEMEKVKEADCLFASSVLIFCYNTAWTISTQLGGWIIEAHGFHVSFIAAATLYLTAVGFYWYFFRRSSAEATICDSTPAQAA